MIITNLYSTDQIKVTNITSTINLKVASSNQSKGGYSKTTTNAKKNTLYFAY